MAEPIGLFPLEHVLLPGRSLPLHIFEPRYRRLVEDVASAGGHGSFGVVLGRSRVTAAATTDAPDSTGEHTLAEIGTMAEIVDKQPYDDGRWDLLTIGRARFRVLEVECSSRPYLRAHVEFLPEPDGAVHPAANSRLITLYDSYVALLAQLGLSDNGAGEETPGAAARAGAAMAPAEARAASYRIASRMQLSSTERQALLSAASTAQRVEDELEVLRREIAVLRATSSVPVPRRLLQVPTSLS